VNLCLDSLILSAFDCIAATLQRLIIASCFLLSALMAKPKAGGKRRGGESGGNSGEGFGDAVRILLRWKESEAIQAALTAAGPAPAALESSKTPAPASAAPDAAAKNNHGGDPETTNTGDMRKLAFEAQQRSAGWIKMLPGRAKLPISKDRANVMAVIEANDVTIISGGTGCGKSTQLPQFLLDNILSSGSSRGCIICTQPRRLAALGVAERVAEERGENIGGTVGYAVRGETRRSNQNTRLLFCTTGVLLRILAGDPELARYGPGGTPVTHVVVDEVHERSCDNELLLAVLRALLLRRRTASTAHGGVMPKVVLMSATLDTETLLAYFEAKQSALSSSLSLTSSTSPLSVAAASVEGRTFPVTRLFLSDALEHSGYDCSVGWRGYARPDMTPTALANAEGSGATTEDKGEVSSRAGEGQEDGAADAAEMVKEMTLGHRMIAENLAKRARKVANVQSNSAVGVGSIGGASQAWMDRVGQVKK
jgi:HrpA-like RNA helicase